MTTQAQAQSTKNYEIVAEATAKNGCNCVPYEQVKTYKLWKAAGRQVQRGQKSYVRTAKPYEYQTTNGRGQEVTKTRLWFSVLFCECQTEAY
jgi:hypothetical protein